MISTLRGVSFLEFIFSGKTPAIDLRDTINTVNITLFFLSSICPHLAPIFSEETLNREGDPDRAKKWGRGLNMVFLLYFGIIRFVFDATGEVETTRTKNGIFQDKISTKKQ